MKQEQPISIWIPESLDGRRVFVRPEPGPFGDHFSTRRVIHAKKTALHRICFFGESVAAGYLYAPHMTPARVLEDQLNHLKGDQAYEVVDLARTNETLKGLTSTVCSSLQLEPDLLVIFSGNNWNLLETPQVSPYNPVLRDRRSYAEKLADQGVEGPMSWAAGELVTKVTNTFDTIAAAVKGTVPVVVVIPEVNLADWASRQPPVRLPHNGNRRWLVLFRQAVAFLEAASWLDLRNTALEMLKFDDGSCPTTYRLLAMAYQASGDLTRARDAARAEIDCCQYANLCFMSAPQINGMGRKLLQRQALRPGFHMLDLAQVFARQTSPLPGRDLFLDYCHLTIAGMKLAMAAVCGQTMHLLENDDRGLEFIWDETPEPEVTPEVDATAKFGAAMHNAHRLLGVGDQGALLMHWCEQALAASPAIAETMLDVAEARVSKLPAVLTSAQVRNRRGAYPLSLQHGWRYDHLDFPLIAAIQRVLNVHDPARATRLEAILLDSLQEQIELTVDHLWEPLARPYPELMPSDDLERHAALRAFWPVTEYGFIASGENDIRLKASLRTHAGPAEMRICINGAQAGTLNLFETWHAHVLILPKKQLKRGINRLSLFWPDPKPCSENPLAEVANSLGRDHEISPHPIYGEIFSLILTFSC